MPFTHLVTPWAAEYADPGVAVNTQDSCGLTMLKLSNLLEESVQKHPGHDL